MYRESNRTFAVLCFLPSFLPSPSMSTVDAIQSLSQVLGAVADSLAVADSPAVALLHNEAVAAEISTRLHRPDSGAGDDNLCRWLYDTFQSNDPDLQLVVLKFMPTIAGVYLSRAISRQPLAGFEAVLLALYAHETVIRGNEAESLTLPDLSNPSVYHDGKASPKKSAAELTVAVVSPVLEPYGTVRSTKRARIVGVALELYYNKISSMPPSSKLNFCEFCLAWAWKGQENCAGKEESGDVKEPEPEPAPAPAPVRSYNVPFPWELFQPAIRIVGHCLLAPSSSEELKAAAYTAVERLYLRATHDMKPQEILAARSLLRLGKMTGDDIVEPTITVNSEYSEEALKKTAQLA
ncbi:uncharacterized protein LOC141837073 [Curcuma longa]|uniref:uncharacterized protein LOC141837073 n=1 Tax=Curcuma longa TaxID=136217 RepID=UPI003D9E028F